MENLSALQKKQLHVRVGLENDPGTIRNIARHRLTVAHINKLFNTDVEFLQEESSGVVVWPKHWLKDCLPKPALYIVRVRVWPTLEPDALEQHNYRGGTRVVVDNVPEEVTEGALTAWLRSGLEDDDPDFTVVKQQMMGAKRALAIIQSAMEDMPAAPGRGAGHAGGLESNSFDVEAKRVKTQALNAKRREMEASLEANRAEWERVVAEQDALIAASFELHLVETKMPLRLHVWEVRFAKSPRAQKMAYIACHKYNWRDFRLKVHKSTGQALAGKAEELEDAPRAYAEVNMREVTVARRKHGRGMDRFDDERGFYSGHWLRGVRHGTGCELNELGRFQGAFQKDWRRGPGRQMYASGDLYQGPYGMTTNHPRESLLHGDEYADGLPHGLGRFQFVDGSTFEGHWEDGAPRGTGKYTGADGVVLDGTFGEWGALNGHGSESGGTMTRIGGAWRHGRLHGFGTEIDAATGHYEGAFLRGLRHGFGIESNTLFPKAGHFEGWWQLGGRDGRGVLNYSLQKGGGEATLGGLQAGADVYFNPADASAPWDASGGSSSAIRRDDPSAQTRIVGAAVSDPAGKDPTGKMSARMRIQQRAAAAAAPVTRAPASTLGAAAAGAGGPNPTASVANDGAATQRDATKKMQFIAYHGDVQYEGIWRLGHVRPGSLISLRNGAPEPTRHDLHPSYTRCNLAATDLDSVPLREYEIHARRVQARRREVEATVRDRLSKEAENAKSYAHWTARAHALFKGVVKRTRRGRSEIDRIRVEVTGEYESADSDEEPEEAEEEAAGLEEGVEGGS